MTLSGIAVRLHDHRVGVGLHQRVQRPQVRGRFQQPLAADAGLQVLQEDSMESVGRSVVGLVQQPLVVASAAGTGRRRSCCRTGDAVIRTHSWPTCAPIGCQRHEPGDDLLAHLQGGLGFGDPRVGLVRFGLRHRERGVDLPRQRRPQRRVLGEQVEQDRGAGAGLSDDEDRSARPSPLRSRDGPCATRRPAADSSTPARHPAPRSPRRCR